MIGRIPIRLRLTLVFAAAASIVLVVAAALLYLRLGAALDDAMDRSLRQRADDVVSSARLGGLVPGRLGTEGEGYVQLVSSDGAVVGGSAGLRAASVLSASQRQQALREDVIVERSLPGTEEPVRLLARALPPGSRASIVVVGTSTEPAADALESLLTQLAVLGPVVLLLSSLAAYGLTAAALRPVEAMRAEAASVQATAVGRRLTVPPADDEIAHLAETLNAMLERLETALERERRFVADAGHELRTPLASLIAELELASSRERTPEELAAAIRSAAVEAGRLARLAEDLLVLARASGGRLELRPERLVVNDLLERVRARHTARVLSAGRVLDAAPAGSLELLGDGLRLEQALGNLVENAVVHGRGPIRLRAERVDGVVELHVSDAGDGIAPELGDAAFHAFTKADRARSVGGAGLGLAIVDAIARAHGGSVHTDRSDAGADVWIAVPQR